MSWQAQTAVNHHSKQANMGLFRLLMFLAENADEAGGIDPAPNQETLAEFFGCSDRTIRNRLNVLQDSGELTQTRVGSGPGNPSAYQINLEIPGNNEDNGRKGGRKAEENIDIISTFGKQMEEIKAEISELKAEISELKAEISELKAEKVETKGGKGGNERRKDCSTESADDPTLDPSLNQEEEEESLSSANADYQAIRQRWLELFPGKSQPRANNKTLTGKAKTRMKSEHFRQNWADALERASHSTFLGNSTFWCLDWFLQNDTNYEKCLNGNYDDRGTSHSQNGHKPHQPTQRNYLDIISDAVDEVMDGY